MNKVKDFLNTIFEKEQKAIFLDYKKETFEEHNLFVERELNIHFEDTFNNELKITIPFNLIGISRNPSSDRFYKTKENAPYPNKRHVYKISAYSHKRYGTIWACYVSLSNPSKSYRTIDECFIVTKLNDELKIIADFGTDPTTRKWQFYGGDEDKSLRLHALGKPIQVERYLEPNDDEWSMQEYLKEK